MPCVLIKVHPMRYKISAHMELVVLFVKHAVIAIEMVVVTMLLL